MCVYRRLKPAGSMWALPQWRSRNSRWWIIFPRVVEIQLENVNKTTSSCPVAFLCFLEAMRQSFNPPQRCSHSKKKTAIHHPSPDFR